MLLEQVGPLLRDKLDIKRELVIVGLERRGEVDRWELPANSHMVPRGTEVLAIAFLHKEDKQEIIARREELETEGVRVTFQHNPALFTFYPA